MFLFSLNITGMLDFGGAECLEPLPHPPPCPSARYFLPPKEQRRGADDRRRKRDEDVEDRREHGMCGEELPQGIPGEDCGEPQLIAAQQPPDREAEDADATGSDGRQPFRPGTLCIYI